MAIKVYAYHQDFGRIGSLSGLFTADEEDVETAMGQEVYLDEVLGKHSEVEGSIDDSTVVLASEDPTVITFVSDALGGGIGVNIIQCWKDKEEWDEEE